MVHNRENELKKFLKIQVEDFASNYYNNRIIQKVCSKEEIEFKFTQN